MSEAGRRILIVEDQRLIAADLENTLKKLGYVVVGNVASGEDAIQYVLAGASLVGVGTAALKDPSAPERIVRELDAWCRRHLVEHLLDLSGSLEWPTA